jgi:SAM-dependent methyltransferase
VTPERAALLDRLLANELDVAYRRRARWLIEALELDGAPQARVLDVGCGPGWYLHAISRLYGNDLTAVDADPARVDAASALAVAEVRLGDAQELPFADATFDRVLMSEVLEHLPDDARALREVHRVLRPGGILALSVPHVRYPALYDPISVVWGALGGAPLRRGPVVGIWTNHERLYEPVDLVGRIREAGLDAERVQELTHYCFPFTGLLVYGIGKPLLERGLVPERLSRSADRFRGEENAGAGANPINVARRAFDAVDALNERPRARTRGTFVNIAVQARKPAAGPHEPA